MKLRRHRAHIFDLELNIYAHRLFGPLPDIATYLCYWEFDVGRITGEVKPSFLLGTTCFAQTFVYDMIDEDNAVPSEIAPAADPDVTFVKANVKHVDVCLMNAHSAAKFTLDEGLALNFDNLVNQDYTQRVNLSVPSFAVTGLANQDQYTTQNSLNQVKGERRIKSMYLTASRQPNFHGSRSPNSHPG